MLQNARVTAFTVFLLLRKNQQGVKLPLPHIRVKRQKLSIKEIVLIIHVTLVKPRIMPNLDGMNIVTQLKVQNHGNTFKKISTTVLHWLLFQIHQNMLRPGRTERHHTLLKEKEKQL